MASGFFLQIPEFSATKAGNKGRTAVGLQNRCTTTVLSRPTRSFPRFLRKPGQHGTRKTREGGSAVAAREVAQSVPVTIPRRRGPTPGCWEGIKPTDDLLAMYGEDGHLLYVFDSSIEVDLEIPDGPEDEPLCIAELRARAGEPFESDRRGLTYFIGGDVGAIKIGRSVNLEVRLKDIQACSPIPIRILATRQGVDRERLYHKRFASFRLHGEWFDRCPEIEAEIARLNAKEPTP